MTGRRRSAPGPRSAHARSGPSALRGWKRSAPRPGPARSTHCPRRPCTPRGAAPFAGPRQDRGRAACSAHRSAAPPSPTPPAPSPCRTGRDLPPLTAAPAARGNPSGLQRAGRGTSGLRRAAGSTSGARRGAQEVRCSAGRGGGAAAGGERAPGPGAVGVAGVELRARGRVWARGTAVAWDARRPTAPHHGPAPVREAEGPVRGAARVRARAVLLGALSFSSGCFLCFVRLFPFVFSFLAFSARAVSAAPFCGSAEQGALPQRLCRCCAALRLEGKHGKRFVLC